jgi:hypothetical protein
MRGQDQRKQIVRKEGGIAITTDKVRSILADLMHALLLSNDVSDVKLRALDFASRLSPIHANGDAKAA